ncbi:MAG: hypothetical protein KBF82_08225 [Chitinophagaceae bacterium]|nr:hypothetical protein [Chitinophagaceae bacterium]MBP9103832.1 hypothetical protein [Chitinophagaceae bacterium]
MAKKIYSIIAVITIIIIIYLILNPQTFASRPLLWVVTILYTFLVGAIHGILGHSLSSKQKGNLIFYPLLMGILFSVLVFIYLYVVLPLIVPGFM